MNSTMTTTRNRSTRHPIQTALTLIPALLTLSLITVAANLYHNRRRLTPEPIHHPVLLFRDPRHCLSHPGTRIFHVRGDRNILASGPLATCHFEPTLDKHSARLVARVPRSKLNRVLAYFIDLKQECDRRAGLGSPLPFATEGTPAGGIEKEWVRLAARGLQNNGILTSGGNKPAPTTSPSQEWKKNGYVEIWEAVIINHCEGWVIEPDHVGILSLEDDDEDPFTWINSTTPEYKSFDGQWISLKQKNSFYRNCNNTATTTTATMTKTYL